MRAFRRTHPRQLLERFVQVEDRVAEESRAGRVLEPEELEVRLSNERSGLQRVVRAFSPHLADRDEVQFAIERRRETGGTGPLSPTGTRQPLRDLLPTQVIPRGWFHSLDPRRVIAVEEAGGGAKVIDSRSSSRRGRPGRYSGLRSSSSIIGSMAS